MAARSRLCCLVVLLVAAGWSVPAPAQQQFTFGLFGDLAYTAAQEPLLDNVLADLNRTPLAFVVHVGLGSRAGAAPMRCGPPADAVRPAHR
jgi:hypothetical protein